MKSLRDNIAVIGFVVSTLALALVYYLFQRRGQKISDLTYDLLKQRLDSKMEEARKQLHEAKQKSQADSGSYAALLHRYERISKKLGLRDRTNRPDAGRDQAND